MSCNNLAKFRKEQHLTLSQLAELTNLSVGYLCHLELGSRNNPSMQVMKRICIALNKNLTDIFNI